MKVIFNILLIVAALGAAYFSQVQSKKFEDRQALRLETVKKHDQLVATNSATEKDLKTQRDVLTTSRNDRAFAATGPIGGSPIDGPVAIAALERLRRAVERESFARAGAGAGGGAASGAEASAATTADLREVLSALRGGVDRGVRLRAALAPASVLARWFAVGARLTGQG